MWVEYTSFRKVALFLIVFLSLAAACVPTPVYTISGRVSGSWQCVDMASTIHPPTITLSPLDWTLTFSRSEPGFSFDNVREGDYMLVVTCSAYGSTYPPMPVTVSGEDLTVDVVLPFPHLPRYLPSLKLNGHTGRVRDLVFSPHGSELVSASEDGTVIHWNPVAGEQIKTWHHGRTDPHLPLILSPDGAILAAGVDGGTIRLWESEQGDLLHTLPGTGVSVTNLTFSDDGESLAAWAAGDDGLVTLWDVISREHLGSIDVFEGLELRRGPSKSILFLPGEAVVVSAIVDNRDLTLSRWDVATGSLIESTRHLSPQFQLLTGIKSAAISWDGTRVALGMIGLENSGGLLIWDLATGRSLVGNYEFPITHVEFSPDGKLIASTAHDNTVVLWDVATGEASAILVSDLEGIDQFVWSPTGRLLAAADEKGTILLWEVP